MKKVLFTIALVVAITLPALAIHAQVKDVSVANEKTNNIAPRDGNTNSSSAETIAPKKSKKSKKKSAADQSDASSTATPAKPSATNDAGSAATDPPAKTVAAMIGSNAPAVRGTSAQKASSAAASEAAPLVLTNTYRVGTNDVLDIRLLNAQTRESTLFTVLAEGLLEYPLAGEALKVAGLTTDEIGARLAAKIKVYDKPQVMVSVREYASHNVIVTGLVNDPGSKSLRREAVPLYVLLAESQVRPEAGRATIMRAGQKMVVNLSDAKATAELVLPGDVITLMALPPPPPQFYFIGGQISAPGQKDFHAGLTLTQAVLASGGTTRFANGKVKVSRQGADGRLVMTEYNLKQIEAGKIPDPFLEPGDRLEISRGRW